MRESEGTKHASLRAESGGPLINERRYGRAGAGTENRPLSHTVLANEITTNTDHRHIICVDKAADLGVVITAL